MAAVAETVRGPTLTIELKEVRCRVMEWNVRCREGDAADAGSLRVCATVVAAITTVRGVVTETFPAGNDEGGDGGGGTAAERPDPGK